MRLSRAPFRTLPFGERERRTLAFGAVSVAVILLVGRGGPALRRWDSAERAAAADAVLRAETAQWALTSSREVQLQAVRGRERMVAVEALLLDGRTTAEAGESLASLVAGVAEDSGMEVTSASVRRDSLSAGAFTRVAVRLAATGDVAGMAATLRRLESDEFLLSVRELVVTQAEPAAPDDRAESLRIEILVEGLTRHNERR